MSMNFEPQFSSQSISTTHRNIHPTTHSNKSNSSNKSLDDFTHRSESFKMLPKNDTAAKKLAWLRSQIIGVDAEFDSPFGKRRIVYADHTASGRSLHYIENYIINNVLPYYGNTHTSDSYVGQRTTQTTQEATEYIKRRLGGGQDDTILFCGSGTTAAIKRLQEVMAVTVPSTLRDRVLKIIKEEERWVVFVGPYEHHSNLLSWRQSLVEVIEIGLDENGLLDMDELRVKLEIYRSANRPILGSFSACSNVTGIYSDTRALARVLHQYGGFVCFDFAASGSYVEIDMKSGEIDGYDAIFLSPHKFIGGPGSPGILLMSNALYQLGHSAPSTCGGGTVDFVNGFDEKDTLYMEDIEERENAGTPPIIQKTRAALAFWVKEYIGYETIKTKEHEYVKKALTRILPNKNIQILGNTSVDRLGIISFLIYTTKNYSSSDNENNGGREEGLYLWKESGDIRDKPLHGPFVAKLLNDLFGIQARGGCACAGPYGHSLLNVDKSRSLAFRSAIQMGYSGVKPGWTRISFPYYMSHEEFEFILASLEFISIYGQRFLPLYNFNWKTGTWTFKNKIFNEKIDNNNNNKHDNKYEGMIKKYASYLENAKRIANLLPKFPAQRSVPDDIDLGLVHFRV